MTQRVLIVEDEPEFGELMSLWLERAGYETFTAQTGADAVRAVYERRPDAVTLDVTLPRLDGWQVCARIREMTSVPIVIVSARGAEEDRLRGLRLGADDYITKPFSLRELVARVGAVLRRASAASDAPKDDILRHGGLVIDRAAHAVLVEGHEVRLTPTEFRLLSALAEGRGRLVSHEQLLKAAWGASYGSEIPLLRTAIRGLRAKLEGVDPGSTRIETEYGFGYRLAAR